MLQGFKNWFSQLPYNVGSEYQQARLLQVLLVATAVGATLWVMIMLGLSTVLPQLLQAAIYGSIVLISSLGGAIVLRRGAMQAAVWLEIIGILLGVAGFMIDFGLQIGVTVMLALALPITLASLFLPRRSNILVGALCIAPPAAAYVFPTTRVFPLSAEILELILLITSAIVVTLLGLFLRAYGNSLRETLLRVEQRERELERIRERQETIIQERTSQLQTTLNDLQTRSAEQARLLEENLQQRAAIRELSVPVLPVSTHTLVMPLIGALDTDRLAMLQEQALQAVSKYRARFLLLDLTALPVVDSQVALGLINAAQAVRLLGADVALIGVRPEVAQTVIGLGLPLNTLHTYRDLQSAIHATHKENPS